MAGVRLIGVMEELFILDALAERVFGPKAALLTWVGAAYQRADVLCSIEEVRSNFLPYARAGKFLVPSTNKRTLSDVPEIEVAGGVHQGVS